MKKQSEWYAGFLKGEATVLSKGLLGAWRSYNELSRWDGWCNIDYYKGFEDYLNNYKYRKTNDILRKRIEDMLTSCREGTYTAPNRINGVPTQDFSQLNDEDTVYAGK